MTSLKSNKFESDLQFVMECLKEVLQELRHEDLIAYIPWLQDGKVKASKPGASPFGIVQLLSISFQLLSMIEENLNVQNRRRQQADGNLEKEAGLWPWAFDQLKASHFSEEQILQVIQNLNVEAVLTAHPTESKRATVLEHHRDLYLLLVKRENQMWTPVEQQWLKDEVKLIMERLWRTGEIYAQRPDVRMELRNMMHYLRNVFPEILPWLDRRFETAWEQAGFQSDLDCMQGHYPSFKLGNWVGGDRDGHPLISAEVTQKALQDLRLNALIVLRRKLKDLAKKLSLSDQVQTPPRALLARLEFYAEHFPESYRAAATASPGESWRILVSIMIDRLPIEVVRDHATQLDDRAFCYQRPKEVMADFAALRQGLYDINAQRLAENEVKSAIRTLQTFGFHTACLDIRQNSRFHDDALSQLLASAGVARGASYQSWTASEKHELIRAELDELRPFALRQQTFQGQIFDVMSCYRAVGEHVEKYGLSGIGSFIVSMTHSADDLFSVYLLMRESGLAEIENQRLVCPIPVVPLFETIDDLQDSAKILDKFLGHPITSASLKKQTQKQGYARPRQQVMIGYSDSCKDGGILASQWNLYLAQREMSAVAERHGVDVFFFHGRGGTVSRGAGPMHRFLQALPKEALTGTLRMTEQGETIARKYANQATAVYNLEMMQASLTAETLQSRKREDDDPFFVEIMTELAATSRETYRSLITQDDFISFFRQATPIDVLERSRIGSRPPKRTGKPSLDDLRAIPWVFAWNQSRFYLPSWYGVGTALAKLRSDRPQDFKKLCERLPRYTLLNYILYNVEITVASASEKIMTAYGDLVEDPSLRARFMQPILAEFERTRTILVEIFGLVIDERRPHVVKTIQFREQSLTLLHGLQIQQLKAWRQLPEASPEYEAQLENLLLTINAIAGGLRNTG